MSPSESHLQHHVSLQDPLLFVLFFFPCGLFVSLFNPRVACLVYSKLHVLLDYGTTIFLETRKATLTPTLKRSHFKKNSFPDEENSLFKLKEIVMRTYLSLRILTHSFFFRGKIARLFEYSLKQVMKQGEKTNTCLSMQIVQIFIRNS